jgi:hypothetical protein
MIPKWPRDGDDNGKPFQVRDSGSVDTCSGAKPLSRLIALLRTEGSIPPIDLSPTESAGPSFPSALSQRPAQISVDAAG